jgi:hypothetical protein
MKLYRKFPVAAVVCILSLILIATSAYAYVYPNAAGLSSQIIAPLPIAAAGMTFLRKQIGAAFAALSRQFRQRADV